MAIAYFDDEATAKQVYTELKQLDPEAKYLVGINCVNAGFDWAIESPASNCPDYLVSNGKAEEARHWRACL